MEDTLRDFNNVKIAVIQNHLHNLDTGVKLGQHELPKLNDGQWRGYKAILENEDLDKIILWWENNKYTRNETCRIRDLLPKAENLVRVQSFIKGDNTKRRSPIDLTSAEGMELCVLTDSIESKFLYVIDGNHRLIAHRFQGRPLNGVPTYVAIHNRLNNWVYIPDYHKSRLQS